MRHQRPPPRPFPQQSRLECPSLLFERVVQASDAQYAAQLARDALPPPTPRSWHAYHPQPTPPIPICPPTPTSPSSAHHGSSTPMSRYSSLGNVADALAAIPAANASTSLSSIYTPSPYPPAAPQPTPAQRLSNIFPFSSTGSTSTIYKTVIKRPALVQLYLNGDELHTNAPDVESQFLAELRAYRVPGQHANIVGFLGCLDSVGMVLECIEGDTFFERVIKKRTSCATIAGPNNTFNESISPAVTPRLKVEWFNQLLDALVHVHKHGLSHGDVNTLNVLITHPTAHPPNIVKLIDFGRSTFFNPLPPNETSSGARTGPTMMGTGGRGPISSFHLRHPSIGASTASTNNNSVVNNLPPSEVPQPSAHPFAAPELLRGGRYIDPVTKKRVPCDGRLADAYALGVLLWCLDEEDLVDVDQSVQKKEEVVLFDVSDDEEDVAEDDPGYGAGDEDDYSPPHHHSATLENGNNELGLSADCSSPEDSGKMVLDEGYHSADADWKSRMTRGSMLAKTRPVGGGRKNLTSMGKPRLFTKLIKGYMKKWEERTRISLDQKMVIPPA